MDSSYLNEYQIRMHQMVCITKVYQNSINSNQGVTVGYINGILLLMALQNN